MQLNLKWHYLFSLVFRIYLVAKGLEFDVTFGPAEDCTGFTYDNWDVANSIAPPPYFGQLVVNQPIMHANILNHRK